MKTMINRREIIYLLAIFIAAFTFRVIYISTLSNHELYFADATEFDSIARSLAAGNGYSDSDGMPTAAREPVYPVFLAAIYKIAWYNLLAVRVCQAFLGAITCIIIYFIGKQVFSIHLGRLSSIVACIYPFFIYYNGHILSETLFIFLFLVTFSILLNIQRIYTLSDLKLDKNITLGIITGILFGICALCKSNMLVSIPFLMIGLFFITKHRLYLLKEVFLIIFAFFMIVTPWLYRNHLIFKKAVIRVGVLDNLWFGNNPYFGDSFDKECAYIEEIKKVLRELSPPEQMDRVIEETFKYIKDNPSRSFRNMGIKFIRFWRPCPQPTPLLDKLTGVSIMKVRFISILSDGTIILLGIMGLIISFRDWHSYLLIYIWIASQTFIFVISYPLMRYRLPLMPFVIIFAGLAVVEIIKRRKRKCLA